MDDQILKVADAIAEWTGIVVHKYHYPMLEYELIRLAGGRDAQRSAALVLRGDSVARRKLISVISNSETYLFRHWGHFEALRRCAERRLAEGRPFSVLSAGCSSGEECWSAAATVGSVYLSAGRDNFSVTGWDIDPERLTRARSGVYGAWATREGLHGYESFFKITENRWKITNTLRRFVNFETVNLVEGTWPSSERFDAIFFRNVSIYWERKTANDVKNRLTANLSQDGIMLIAPSDPVVFNPAKWSVETGSGAPVFRRIADTPDQPDQVRRKTALPANSGIGRSNRISTLETKRKRSVARPRPAAFKKPAATKKPVVKPRFDEVEALANTGQYEKALETLLSLGLALSPAQKLWEGILLLNLDRVQEAIKVFRHCVFLEPEEPSYRRWLAVALDSAGHKSEAARENRNARNIEVEV